MGCLRFNIYALAAPATSEEYIAFLEEAVRTAADLAEQTLNLSAQLERFAIISRAKGWEA